MFNSQSLHMQQQQHTIRHIVGFEGIGLHTGISVKGRCIPMPVDTGIQFQRVDLPAQPIIEALVAYTAATERSTVLKNEQASVATIEHLLAALAGLQIDNICIQLDGPEVPDLDGSAQAFVTLLLKAGRLMQSAPRKFFKLKEKFVYNDLESDAVYEIYPDTHYGLCCTIDYGRWPLENQYATLSALAHFKETIATARTFVYLDEIIALYSRGLLQGGDPTKALILSEHTSNQEMLKQVAQLLGKEIGEVVMPGQLDALRYPNEPARHKLLDLIGDMALLGRPLLGKVFAYKPGHGPNRRFSAVLRKFLIQGESKGLPMVNLQEAPILDANQIKHLLPHRYPFQLVDKIMQLDQTSITGIKNVTINEPFFQGHFPEAAVMPGVLQVEALAQTGGLLVLHQVPNASSYLTYFLAIDKCKFRRVVVPGDTLLLHVSLLTNIKFSHTEQKSVGIAKLYGRAFVGDHLVCEAVLLAQIVKHHAG